MEDHLHIKQDTVCHIMKIWEGGMSVQSFFFFFVRSQR